MGGNLLATEAADRAPEQGDLRGRGRARAAEAQRYPGRDLTAWREWAALLPAGWVGLLLAGQVIHRGRSRPEPAGGRYLAALCYARGGCTWTARRRRAGPVKSDVTPGSGMWPGASGPGSVRR